MCRYFLPSQFVGSAWPEDTVEGHAAMAAIRARPSDVEMTPSEGGVSNPCKIDMAMWTSYY